MRRGDYVTAIKSYGAPCARLGTGARRGRPPRLTGAGAGTSPPRAESPALTLQIP